MPTGGTTPVGTGTVLLMYTALVAGDGNGTGTTLPGGAGAALVTGRTGAGTEVLSGTTGAAGVVSGTTGAGVLSETGATGVVSTGATGVVDSLYVLVSGEYKRLCEKPVRVPGGTVHDRVGGYRVGNRAASGAGQRDSGGLRVKFVSLSDSRFFFGLEIGKRRRLFFLVGPEGKRAYRSDGVGLAVVHQRSGSRAVGGVRGHNLSGVADSTVTPGIRTSHEGDSDGGGGTHFFD